MFERGIAMEDSSKRKFDVLTRKWALIILLCASPVYVLFFFWEILRKPWQHTFA